MHHIYTTPAFVVHSSPHGEAGKFLLLFTRDFGMIGVVAQGIRLNQSKLRYHIQDSSFSNVSIVRGKEVWRLTGAHEIENHGGTILHLKILKLLKRLLQGEDKNERLFEIIESMYQSNIEEKDYVLVECITVLRILDSLGYIKGNTEIDMYLKDNSLTVETLASFAGIKSKVLNIVNSALKESQL